MSSSKRPVLLILPILALVAILAYRFVGSPTTQPMPSGRTDYANTGAAFTAIATPTSSPLPVTPTPTVLPVAPRHPQIHVSLPPFGQPVTTSPLTVSGEARGSWFFEASFPVRLLDGNGKELGRANAQARGNWMTDDFVGFNVTVPFTAPTTATGTLVLEKSNASGLPEHADQFRIPVSFDPGVRAKRTVKLYYYDRQKDSDATGNPRCEASGLTAVERTILVSQTPIQDTIRLLLEGKITTAEKVKGISSEYPLSGFQLTGAVLKDGVLTLSFDDPQGKTVGGSCRVGILSAQVIQTAKQFSTVKEVRFQPESGVFQP